MSNDGPDAVNRTDCKPYRDESTLQWAYHERELSARDIADILGCGKTTVLTWMDKLDIERRPGPYREGPWCDEETLREEYAENERSIENLADEWNTSTATIHSKLNEFGIETRGPGHTGENHWNWKGGVSFTDDSNSRTTLEKQPCEWCGELYKPSNSDQKYCSRECNAESQKNRVQITCAACGETVAVPKSREDTAKYCSRGCAGTASTGSTETVTLTCDWCGDTFDVLPSRSHRRFCDDDCATEWKRERFSGEKNPRWAGGPVTVECHYCGDEFEMGRYAAKLWQRHFCRPEHRAEWLSERPPEEHPRYGGGTEPYGIGFNEAKRQAVRERDGHQCQHPGCDTTNEEHIRENGRALHVHHIQKARKFERDKFKNAMGNLVTLCKTHHDRWEQLSPLKPDSPN